MNKLTRLLTTAALALACQGLSAAEVRTAPNVTKAAFREGPPAGKQWTLVWNDEFDGKEIDLNRWQHGSEATYVEPEKDPNTRLDGQGSLVCTLTVDEQGKPVAGNGIHSRSFQKAYGYFETRVQFTTQPGWWGAVWLQGWGGVPHGRLRHLPLPAGVRHLRGFPQAQAQP